MLKSTPKSFLISTIYYILATKIHLAIVCMDKQDKAVTKDTEEDTADTQTVDTEEELSLESDTHEDLVIHD